MIQDIDLRSLAEYEGPERAFLSVYVGGEAGAQSVERRLDMLEALLQDDADALAHFVKNADLARAWLVDHPPGTGTSCVFVCYALDLVQGYQIDLILPTDVRVGVAPYVRPLAEKQDEYETFAIVAADNDVTRIYLVTAQAPELITQIRGDVKNHVKKGGWSQKRYQRRRANELQQYAREVADFLADLSRTEEFDRIVLTGSEETTVAIRDALEPSLAERIITRETIDLQAGETALVNQAFDYYWEAERAAERALWGRIRGECEAGGLGVVGATSVLEALHGGRVDALVVERDAALPGVRCGTCENTVHGSPQSCQICGSKSVIEIDLVNELVRQAELTGAEVEFSDPIPGLTRVGHVAALLRY